MEKLAEKIAKIFNQDEIILGYALRHLQKTKWHQLNNETTVVHTDTDWVQIHEMENTGNEFDRSFKLGELEYKIRELIRESKIGKTSFQQRIDAAWNAKHESIQEQTLKLSNEIYADALLVQVDTTTLRLESFRMVIHNIEILFRAIYHPETDTLFINKILISQ